MKRTVYGVSLSPYVRKVRLCLAHKALDYQLETVLPFNQPDWFLALNPLGRIPAFKEGDLVLADSSVICQYLDDQYPARPLLGKSAEQKARVRWLEKYADYELAPLTTFTVFQQRVINPAMGNPVDEEAVQTALHQQLPEHYDYLEKTLGTQDYFLGDTLSLADIAFACQLINMEHAGEPLDATQWPALAALVRRVQALPALPALFAQEQQMLAGMR